jgi:site-specific recombinase XerC
MKNSELRDHFAGLVLQGFLSNLHLQKMFLKDLDKYEKELSSFDQMQRAKFLQEWHATTSYAFADAMMKEREKGENNDKQ